MYKVKEASQKDKYHATLPGGKADAEGGKADAEAAAAMLTAAGYTAETVRIAVSRGCFD